MSHCLVATCDELMKKMNLPPLKRTSIIFAILSISGTLGLIFLLRSPIAQYIGYVFIGFFILLYIASLFAKDKDTDQDIIKSHTAEQEKPTVVKIILVKMVKTLINTIAVILCVAILGIIVYIAFIFVTHRSVLTDLNWPLFIASAITTSIGVIGQLFSSKSPLAKRTAWVLIGFLILLCIASPFAKDKSSNQATAESSTPASTATSPSNSIAPATPTTPTTTATAATDANEASAGTDPYLAELKVLQYASDVYYNKTYEVSGQPYVHSILAECGSNCTTQKKISYNLGKKYRKLTFGVGIEDNSATREQVAVFTLIADGKPIFEKTAQKNEPVTSQEVDVTDVLTLELAVTATKNKSSQLVWMTPQLHS